MGLDTTHDAWSGGYISFNHWRNTLAEAAGYKVQDLVAQLDWDNITDDNLHGVWAETPSDPLVVLLAHYDCEGVIGPEQSGPLADRIEGLLDKLPSGQSPGHIRDWRETTQKFIDGLRLASTNKEVLEFF